MSTVPALDIRLAPEYRRCAIYTAVGFGLVAGVVVGFRLTGVEDVPWVNVVTALVGCAITSVGLLVLVVRYRLRIDHHGVWRRRFVRWDLWPWEAFESGKVRHGKAGDQLTYPDKGRYWRTISTSLLSETDRAAFETVVRRYRVLPPPPELPAVLTIRQGLQTQLELSAEGVRVGDESVPWPDVVRVEVVRATHDRRDFQVLDLYLPDQPKPVRLFQRNGQASWRGPDAEVIALSLRRHLDDGRFQSTALRGPPADLAEADRRLARLAEVERRLRTVARFTWGMLAALVVFVLQPWDWRNPLNGGQADWVNLGIRVGAVVFGLGLFAAMIVGFVYFQNRDLRRQKEDLLAWRTGLNPVADNSRNLGGLRGR